jgi:hypothetical protein
MDERRRARQAIPCLPPWSEAELALDKEQLEANISAGRKAADILREIRKVRATTAAGIYAKAPVVRASRTGANVLAMSLAEDLVDCAELRQSLWPADAAP